MNRFTTFILVCAMSIGSAFAATSGNPISLTITFDLTDSLAIAWADDNTGTNPVDAQTWAIGAVALSGTYDSSTGGTNPAGFKRYLVNESPTNTDTDVYMQISSAPANWTAAGTAASDTYVLKVDVVGGDTDYETTVSDSTQAKVLDLTDNDATSPKMEFQFQTPTAIATGANGSGLSVVVTFTATVDSAAAPADL